MSSEIQSPDFEALVPGLLRQEPAAEEAFFRMAYSRLMSWAQSKFGVPDHAREDFAMEVIEKVLCRLSSFRPDRARFSTWMFVIARNRRLDHLRKVRSGRDPLSDALPDDVLDWMEGRLGLENMNDADAAREPNNSLAPYRERLARLPPEDLKFLELVCTTALTSAEIAAQTQMSSSAVRKRKERLLERLRNEPSAISKVI